MKEKPLVSIIIPVYNGEKYLRPCIESVIKQSYQEWELILVDDGSTDRTSAICDEYARHERITVIHKQNEGQAIARNDGLAVAKGEWVSFIDADDWLESTMYEVMIDTLEQMQADALVCGFFEEYTSHRKEINNDGAQSVLDGQEAVKQVLQGKIGSYLWSMLFRRALLQEPIPNMRCYEDHTVIFKWISHANKVVCLHRALYHYRQVSGSSLHSGNPEKERLYFVAIKERYQFVCAHHLLAGWETENRKVYVKGCIKLAKDLARSADYGGQQRQLIHEVREELKNFLPINSGEIGVKYAFRLRLLMMDVAIFVRIVRLSAVFSRIRKKRQSDLFS